MRLKMILRAVVLSIISAHAVAQSTITLDSPSFSIQLNRDSQTLFSLKPKGGPSNFDFVPSDKMSARNGNNQHHLGDITFRVRRAGTTAWTNADSSSARRAVTVLPASGSTLAAADLTPTLPSGSLLSITRRWVVANNQLELLFDVTNSQTTAVEIGALGAPLEFNNIFTDRTAAQTNEQCSLFDPYIGQDAGFVQVTPLLGTLPPLVVVPVGKSPLEGWRFLPESTSATPFYQSQTFEGLYEWQFHTLAYAQNEWSSVTPWNAATSVTLQPGQTRTYGLQFRLGSSIRNIDATLQAAGRPVTVGIPGFILPTDQSGKLFLNYASAVQSISVSPSGALSWTTNSEARTSGWVGYTITANTFGRSRLTITYADGTVQTVHYHVTKGATQAISTLGNFLTTNQWFNDPSDPFTRSPSVISYDREVNAIVKNDPRAWIPGLSDEAGAGSWLAAAFKQFVQPNAAEATKMEQFINQTLRPHLQNADGTVKKSVFFYQPNLVPNYQYPSSINWGNWWSWNQAASFAIDRAYDYVHVIAAYWSMYRVARNYPGLVRTSWQWYIQQAVQTTSAMTGGRVGYANDGLMGETVIRLLLDDLKREGLTANVTLIEGRMRTRAQAWGRTRYPFGSEMAWDSTGQEGVYAWAKYFGDATTATNALNSILAYQPTVPHWGYNGNARRYWDNIYGGKLQRIERQLHHYGSGLNALPVISAFQSAPTDYYLLRVGYGGLSGPLSNIDSGGFASASFHSFADTLKWDAYSGDYGPNFAGHAMGIGENTSCYTKHTFPFPDSNLANIRVTDTLSTILSGAFILNHPDFGWQAFGGTVTATSPAVTVSIKDSVRRRVFIAPIAALLTLDAGAFSTVTFNPTSHTVDLVILPAADGASGAASAPNGRLVISQTATVSGVGVLRPSTSLSQDAGAFVIPFSGGQGRVTLTP
ncbi:hypothetical protein HGRIS_008578 [Hohenbuehelia grisea]|uniref:Uncharacterized protein n=1 Tax=Hohenbuehelia grisea TaxID=104357 RepID=A0ABR3J8G1_9AGAR